MIFLNLLCCKEAQKANIQIGEIKNRKGSNNPCLEVHVQIKLGQIKTNTDFLYLSPQVEYYSHPLMENQRTIKRSNSTYINSRDLDKGEGLEDKDPLPKRLKDVKKDRVILIDKDGSLSDNMGMGFINLSIDSGKYKLYYVRIENEQRVMHTSRLELLGSSSAFTVNKLTSEAGSNPESRLEENKSVLSSYSCQ